MLFFFFLFCSVILSPARLSYSRSQYAYFFTTWKEQVYLVVLRATGWIFKIIGIYVNWKEPMLVYRSAERGKIRLYLLDGNENCNLKDCFQSLEPKCNWTWLAVWKYFASMVFKHVPLPFPSNKKFLISLESEYTWLKS